MNRIAIIAASLMMAACALAQSPASVVASLKQRLAPDSRTALWNVQAKQQKGTVVLTGTVSHATLKAALDSAFAGRRVSNRVTVLEDTQPAGRRWALVTLAVASLRCEGKHSAEMATQAGMGTPVKVLDGSGEWVRVQLPDDYIAYAPESSLDFRTAEALAQWRQARRVVVTAMASRLLSEPAGDWPVSDLVLGNILEWKGQDGEWVQLATPDGRTGWVERAAVDDFDHWRKQPFDPDLIERTAMQMMGCGYLWGGTSTKVTDCSGLMKVSHLASGIILQRDASQQALTGLKIADWHQCERGDLLFFGNSKTGRVTHVGMYLRDGKYVHCSGRVKVNSLDPGAADYLYSPLSISRVRGQVGTRGITTVAAHPWY